MYINLRIEILKGFFIKEKKKLIKLTLKFEKMNHRKILKQNQPSY
jgi:hypothetical protein